MAGENDVKAKSKHRKSTCAGCRRRKSKCDGKTPKCTTCIAYKDDCHYDKPPSLAYVRSLEEEIQELKTQLRQTKAQIWLSRATSHDEKKLPSASPASDTAGSQGSAQILAHRHRAIKWESDISVDDSGSVTFHNSTSTMYEPPAVQHHHPPVLHASTFGPTFSRDDQHVRRDLVLNATHQRQIEPFAIANGAAKTNVPKEISLELLKYHWCWQHPLFLVVYRPAFTKGMSMVDLNPSGAQNPPYFSETLLKVLHAHCARFLNHDIYQNQYLTAPEFMQKMTEEARFSLGMDILKDSSIATIQALLQQSARDVMFGYSSQSWTFAGIAFRMALDMGIHLPSDKLQAYVKCLTNEDIEIRKRLFWSCYTWDKILSLYLGRMPGFAPSTDDVPLSFMDDYSDNDLWSPYYGEAPNADISRAPEYPPCPGYVVSCFRQLCRLCTILNDMMHNIYSGDAAARRDLEEEDSSAEVKAANDMPFIRIAKDLRDWLVSLPPHLRLNPEQMPHLAPPAHIMSLNLLYHSTIILLHRPVVLGARDLNLQGPARSYQICVQATAAIHDLILLQAKTFGLSHVSYLNAYAVYIASTIAVLRFEREVQPGDDPAVAAQKHGLTYLLDVLQKASNNMPALERSNAIIRKRVKAALDRQKAQSHRSYSNGSTPPRFSMATPTSQRMELAQSTAFHALSNPVLTHVNYSQSEQPGTFATPISWQSGSRSTLYLEQGHVPDDFLPAFPGQQFPVGSEHSFGSSEADHHSRTALLGYNLDPHPRLNSGDIDWNFMDHYEQTAVPI